MDRGAIIRKLASSLLLFDIDGTLVRRAGPDHRQALEDAVRETTGIPVSIANIATQGMLDGEIIAVMLRQAGAAESLIEEALPAIMEQAQCLYSGRCPDLRRRVCPGARSLLYRLSRRKVLMGLVTGNLSRIGWKKMERAGLRRYLHFGAFAESGRERRHLVANALSTARAEGWIDATSRVALVGDHENDILAAQANGIPIVSVATGLSPAADLAKLRPDYLIDDLRSFPTQALGL